MLLGVATRLTPGAIDPRVSPDRGPHGWNPRTKIVSCLISKIRRNFLTKISRTFGSPTSGTTRPRRERRPPRRTGENPARCRQPWLPGPPEPARSRPFAEPFGQPSLSLFLGKHALFFDGSPPALDLFTNVDVVLDIFKRRIVREGLQQFADLFLGGSHGDLLGFLPRPVSHSL